MKYMKLNSLSGGFEHQLRQILPFPEITGAADVLKQVGNG